MELEPGRQWRIFLTMPGIDPGFLPPDRLGAFLASPELCPSPGTFAAAEIAGCLSRAGFEIAAGRGDEDEKAAILILDCGSSKAGGKSRGFAWRASGARVEIHGDSEAGLLSGAYDFLGKAGFRWIRPGEPARLPQEGRLVLAAASGRAKGDLPRPILILGHGSYLEKAQDYMLWAARNGYSGLFIHTTGESLAYGAAPIRLYDSLRDGLAALSARLGLPLELGGHGLSALLPRTLFRKEPGLFRMEEGLRKADRNFCPSNPKGLRIVGENFASFVAAHPEIEVFHVWPDDLPGGGWCECPACAGLSPAAQSLSVAASLAAILAEARPDAKLSFLAYHDTEDLSAAVKSLGEKGIPPNLELLWAPRKRSWAASYGDPASALNSASRVKFEAAREAFLEAGGSSVSIFEYWEDAILFKTAVPPLASCMEGDLAYYAEGRKADKIGVLLTGDRLPLAPRPNLWFLPRLLGGEGREDLWKDWCASAYGGASEPMLAYWKALEAAWAINLDLEQGETEIFMPLPMASAGRNPPADWGDPWKASAERLKFRRGRCEEAFDLLRAAEAALGEARACRLGDRAGEASACAASVEGEALEYAISSGIIELDSARLSAYHELAQGEGRAAADIALIGLSVLDGLHRAFRSIPDPRSRRNAAFILYLHYELRLRAMARAPRGFLRGKAGEAAAFLGLARRAAGLARVWEPRRSRGRNTRGRGSRGCCAG